MGHRKKDGEAQQLGSEAQDTGAEAAVASGSGGPTREPEAWSSTNPYQKAIGTMAATSGAPEGTGTVSVWTRAATTLKARRMAAALGSRMSAHPASMADRSTLVGHQTPSLRPLDLFREQPSIGEDRSRTKSEVRTSRLTTVVVSKFPAAESLRLL